MQETLQPGLEGTSTVVVGKEHTPRHLLATIVLSTPLMIQFMEQLSTDTVAPHLDDGETTVGTHVDVYHRSAAREGEEVVFRSLLRTVDGRQLRFAVSAHCGERLVGEGTHERFVVDRDRFESRARLER